MRIEVHVKSVDDVAAAKDSLAAPIADGDEIVIIVAQPAARPAERQERKVPV